MAEEMPFARITRNHNTVRMEVRSVGVISRPINQANNHTAMHANGASGAAADGPTPGPDAKPDAEQRADFQSGYGRPPP